MELSCLASDSVHANVRPCQNLSPPISRMYSFISMKKMYQAVLNLNFQFMLMKTKIQKEQSFLKW